VINFFGHVSPDSKQVCTAGGYSQVSCICMVVTGMNALVTDYAADPPGVADGGLGLT
jgi:hypothetical protein